MTVADVLSAISSVGFPIVCCAAMAWFVYHTTEKQRDEIAALNEKHYEEIKQVTEAINNNTVALTKLADKLDGEA